MRLIQYILRNSSSRMTNKSFFIPSAMKVELGILHTEEDCG